MGLLCCNGVSGTYKNGRRRGFDGEYREFAVLSALWRGFSMEMKMKDYCFD